MTNAFEAVPAAKQTGDEDFFWSAIAFRDLQQEVLELEAKLNHLLSRKANFDIGDLIPLTRLEEIRNLSGIVDEKKAELEKIVDGLVSKFYPENPEVRDSLKGIWIGIKRSNTAVRISEDLKSFEVGDWPQ